ncbi:hypothetical protein KC343_g986 [Hortaea werneckii]|nr:hypothetical protein KC352_g7194 [Hortaea werneckii]KAI7572154.1 hypothetical protein KC317_g1005 [Hortaea werneckii]KAI7636909.1 hypothetical protein KC343_g986 [Hortaea werneckii]KAI7680945.1 hypothetical protein KC319_g1854 [Hortaea werneckii]KAI7723174.1 hypothetical protein KC322_g1237 [Hortaea werneckii]
MLPIVQIGLSALILVPPTIAQSNAATSARHNFNISNFAATFASGSGVLESLRPSSNRFFDFSPSDVFSQRNGPGQYHTGDLTFRYRAKGADEWYEADTAATDAIFSSSTLESDGLLHSNLNHVLPGLQDIEVSRTWSSTEDGDLALSFTLQNTGPKPIELGSLGMLIEFNNIFTGRTAVETTNKCVLIDPYIGLNAGYLQVTRLTGTGPNLVVTPLNEDSKFEAWRFLEEPEDVPLGYQVQTYEGNYAWEVFTQAYAEKEWQGVQPWNEPSSRTLDPGENLIVGLKFSLAEHVQRIEETVASNDVPVAVGFPGYVLPRDLVARLFVNSSREIESIESTPSGALSVSQTGKYQNSWTGFDVRATNGSFGRARLDIKYTDGRKQAVHYWIAHASSRAIEELGSFLTNEQWFTNTSDPFGRAPSVITYDRDTDDFVLQENRTWIAGLSDEGGAGSFLAAAMKQAFTPDASEVAKLEEFVEKVVWGRLQIDSGNETYAVRKSLFFYQPELVPGYEYDPYFNWTAVPGLTWDKEAAYLINRAYDYVHVSALYWGLYRAGRTHGLVRQQTPDWYLMQAYHTIVFATSNGTDGGANTAYADLGLMGETVWGYIISDLRMENHNSEAAHLEDLMLRRQQIWASLPDPCGSEMAWDSTGEEGVYYWSNYFNDTSAAQKTVNAIRGYMPTIAHWGWNRNARRYWDFLYAGDIKLARIERQIHHYGSGLNALPLLDNYRQAADPESMDAIYDLRVGYGGIQGPLSNIDAGGFGSMAFHSYPDTLRWDAYSGDYGPNFLGHVLGAATYLLNHPIFGWISFGGNVYQDNGSSIIVETKDMLRKRIFFAPVGLWVTIDAGVVSSFSYDAESRQVELCVESDMDFKSHWKQHGSHGGRSNVMLQWEQSGGSKGAPIKLHAADGSQQGPGGLVLNVSSGATKVVFSASTW